MRYDTPDEKGEKRRDRNERMGVPSPEFVVPEEGEYLWSWFQQLKEGVGRIHDGVCYPIPWSEYLAWAEVTQTIVRADEYGILRAIDAAFCEETNIELQAYNERLRSTPPGHKPGSADDGA